MNKILIVDADKCIGCRMCEAACSIVHYGSVGIANSRLKVLRYDNDAFYIPVVCGQCETPYCASVCPSQAITKNPRTGVVKVAKSKCTGCKACLTACPFGVMGFKDGTAIKCDNCNGQPTCVEFCQAKAITYDVPSEAGKPRLAAAGAKMRTIYTNKLTFVKEPH